MSTFTTENTELYLVAIISTKKKNLYTNLYKLHIWESMTNISISITKSESANYIVQKKDGTSSTEIMWELGRRLQPS